MRPSAEWQRFGPDFPGYSPYPGLRPGDVEAIDAIGANAVAMRPIIEVACRPCIQWLALVWDVTDGEVPIGAFVVIREKHVDTARRMLAEEGRDLAQGSSSELTTAQKSGGVHVVVDDSTPAQLSAWCPKHGGVTVSTAQLRAVLVAARREEKAERVRLQPQQR